MARKLFGSFFGKSRRNRKHRNNPALSIKSPVKAMTAAFDMDLAKRALFIAGANIVTQYVSNTVGGYIPKTGQNAIDTKVVPVVTALGAAGVAGMVAGRFMPSRKNDVMLGGMLVGLTRALAAVFPGTFKDIRMGEDDLSGFGDYVDPRQIAAPIGINDYVDPRQIAAPVSMRGMGDEATVPQAAAAVGLDGFAEQAVAEEIAMQS